MTKKCLNLSHPEIKKLTNDFSVTKVSELMDKYFPESTPSYNEFVEYKEVKKELGIIPISKVKEEIGRSFPKLIYDNQSIEIKTLISNLNNKNTGFVYLYFNDYQLGKSNLRTWGIRKVRGTINKSAKIDRLKSRIVDPSQDITKLNKLDNGGEQGSLFSTNQQLPELNTKVKNHILSILNTLGIKLETLDNLTTKNGLDAVGSYNLLTKVIKLVKNDDFKALPEEFGHFIEDWLGKNHPLLKGLYEVIKDTTEYQEVLEEYKDLYDNEELLKKEAVGQILGKAINKSFELKDRKKNNLLQHIITKLTEYIKSIFNKISDSKLNDSQNKVNNIADRIATLIVDNQGVGWLKSNKRSDFNTNAIPQELYGIKDKLKGVFRSDRGFPFMVSNLDKMEIGEKRATIRPKFHKSGVYTYEGVSYRLTNLGERSLNDVAENARELLKSKFIGEDTIKKEYIKDFFDGKNKMFIYTIQRLKGNAVNELVDERNEMFPEADYLLKLHTIYQDRVKRLKVKSNDLINQIQKLTKTHKEEKQKLLESDNQDKALFIGRLDRDYQSELSSLTNILQNVNKDLGNINPTLIDSKTKITQDLILGKKDKIIEYIKLDLSRIKENIDKVFYDFSSNSKTKRFAEDATILDIYRNISEVKALADELYPAMYSNTIDMADKEAENLNTVDNRKVSFRKEVVRNFSSKDIHKDINVLEYSVGALRDQPRIEGQTLADTVVNHKNIANFNSISDTKEITLQVHKLNDYGKKIGKSFKELLKELTEVDGKGHLSLVKPWTPEWEAKRTKYLGEDTTEAKTWLKVNTYQDEFGEYQPTNPKDFNKQYDKIRDTPELKEFYKYFQNKMLEKANYLPTTYEVSKYKIPNLLKSLINDVSDLTNSESRKLILQSVKDSLFNYEYYDDNGELVPINELEKLDFIPIKYLGEIDPKQKADDLGQVLIKWCQFCNMYKEMSEALPKVRLMEKLINENSYIKGDKIVKGTETNLSKMVNDYIKMQVLGRKNSEDSDYTLSETPLLDEEGNEIGIKKVQLSTLIDSSIKYVSLLNIGYNPFTALNNIIVGNLNNFYDASGGRFFTKSNFMEAFKIISTQGYKEDSKLNQLIELIRPFQEYMDAQYMEEIYSSNTLKEGFKAYSWMRKGEYINQGVPMIAKLLNKKVQTKDGKSISLWDAWKTDEDGKIYWDKETTGIKLDEKFINKLRNEVQRINQYIHGRYTPEDASVLKQHWWFRGAILFRSWIPSALESRFIGYREDTRLGLPVEGRYISFKNFIDKGIDWRDEKGKLRPKVHFKLYGQMLKEVWDGVEKLSDKSVLTELEVANMRKNATEISIMISITALTALFSGGDDDKKRDLNPVEKLYLDQLNRINNDIYQFVTPGFYLGLYENQPLLRTYKQLLGAVINLPHIVGNSSDDFYRSGNRKGENKEWSRIIELTPLIKQVNEFHRLFNGQPKVYPEYRY